MDDLDSQEIIAEAPAENIFIPPSVDLQQILAYNSYTYHSPIPSTILANKDTECVLGIDEAGRGPVLGPMVYGLFYLPIPLHHTLLAHTHHFDDSKVLTPTIRSTLIRKLCTTNTDLFSTCGWATRSLSARDISAHMLQPATFNLNAQAIHATITLIREVLESGINVREIYIDTIGKPEVYQRKLEPLFPGITIVVAKKADSLYPCVSAASVCAKVTRDAALEVAADLLSTSITSTAIPTDKSGWGSGYPSDARCTSWLRREMDPLFGWGGECRFSWGTAKDMLDKRDAAWKVEWPVEDDGFGGGEEERMVMSRYLRGRGGDCVEDGGGDDGRWNGLAGWWGGGGVGEGVL